MGKARTAKQATVSEDPRAAWEACQPGSRESVRGMILVRQGMVIGWLSGGLTPESAVERYRAELAALNAALALLSDPPQPEPPKRGKRGGASS